MRGAPVQTLQFHCRQPSAPARWWRSDAYALAPYQQPAVLGGASGFRSAGWYMCVSTTNNFHSGRTLSPRLRDPDISPPAHGFLGAARAGDSIGNSLTSPEGE